MVQAPSSTRMSRLMKLSDAGTELGLLQIARALPLGAISCFRLFKACSRACPGLYRGSEAVQSSPDTRPSRRIHSTTLQEFTPSCMTSLRLLPLYLTSSHQPQQLSGLLHYHCHHQTHHRHHRGPSRRSLSGPTSCPAYLSSQHCRRQSKRPLFAH